MYNSFNIFIYFCFFFTIWYVIWLLTLDMMRRNCMNIAKDWEWIWFVPVERYENTSKKRLDLVCFYESEMGQSIYNRRRISIEPLIEHIKSVFRIDQLPVQWISGRICNCIFICLTISDNGIL